MLSSDQEALVLVIDRVKEIGTTLTELISLMQKLSMSIEALTHRVEYLESGDE